MRFVMRLPVRLVVLWMFSWTMACNQTPFQMEIVPTFGQSFADLDVLSFQITGPALKKAEGGTPLAFDASVQSGKMEYPSIVLDGESKEKWLRVQALGLNQNSNVQAFGAGRFDFPNANPSVFRILLSRTDSFGWLTRMDGAQNGRSSLISKIVGHQSMALPDGRVLLIGGVTQFTEDNALVTLEAREHLLKRVMIYNPNDGSFTTSAQEFANPRAFHSASWLDANRILVVGGIGVIGTSSGFQVQSLGSAEIVDVSNPNSIRIVAAPDQPKRARAFHRAVTLSDSSVLFVGGVANPLLGSDGSARQGQEVLFLEMFDHSSEKFIEVASVSPDPKIGRVWHRATAFSDDTVLVTGGLRIDENGKRKTADEHLLLKRSGTSWNLSVIEVESAGGRKRFDHTATLAKDGDSEWVVVAGGRYIETNAMLRPLEIWDKQGKLVTGTTNLTETRYGHGAIWIPEQKEVLLGGGLSTSSGGLKPVFQGESVKIPSFAVESRPQIQEKSGRYRCDPLRVDADGRSFWLGGANSVGDSGRVFVGLDTGEIYTPRINAP
ncbi:hypothetical protein L6R29_14930 [Myxococcota bacterium]|nr:hypothetical protein [Myxococcota bacterium]